MNPAASPGLLSLHGGFQPVKLPFRRLPGNHSNGPLCGGKFPAGGKRAGGGDLSISAPGIDKRSDQV